MVACHVFHTLSGVGGSFFFLIFYYDLSSYSSCGAVVPRNGTDTPEIFAVVQVFENHTQGNVLLFRISASPSPSNPLTQEDHTSLTFLASALAIGLVLVGEI